GVRPGVRLPVAGRGGPDRGAVRGARPSGGDAPHLSRRRRPPPAASDRWGSGLRPGLTPPHRTETRRGLQPLRAARARERAFLMVSRNLRGVFALPADQLADELRDAFGGPGGEGEWLPSESQDFRENKLLTGRVRRVTGEMVLVDVGYKSEGAVELREWYDEDAGQVVPPRPGDEVQVLLLSAEDESGGIGLSYRKARWQRG